MPAEAVCPHCQLKLRVPETFAGRSVKCAQCQRRFVVTFPSATPAPEAQPSFESLVLSVLDDGNQAATMRCAHCGLEQESRDVCAACGQPLS